MNTNTTWNAQEWLKAFHQASQAVKSGNRSAMTEVRGLRKEVIEHSLEQIREGGYRSASGTWQPISNTEEVINSSRMYHEPTDVSGVPAMEDSVTEVFVKNIDCLLAAKELLQEGYHPAVLNMANRHTPGGGVLYGAGAQEENLCRRSNLYPALEQFILNNTGPTYPMHRDFGGIYTPDVTVFRAEESAGYELPDAPYQVSVISVAGINRPDLTAEGLLTPHMVQGTLHKIRTILRIGLLHGHDSLVLGALGCGAFRNPPRHIAKLFHETLNEEEFRNKYKRIVFAILEDHNSKREHNPEGNYKPFADEFSTSQF